MLQLAHFHATLLLLAAKSITAAQPKCYFPDGTTVEAGHVPCNQTISTPSACCDPLDSCSTSGFCLGRTGLPYRGSCTDQNWGSENCPKQFNTCVTDPSTETPYGRWTAVFSCSPVGTINGEFCCDYSNSESCCPSNFTQFSTGEAFKPGADAREAAIASSAIASAMAANGTGTSAACTATSAPAETSSGGKLVASDCPKGKGDLGTKVGLGVGIPLGVLVFAILAFLGWREWSKHHVKTAAYSSASRAIPSRESGGGLVGVGFHKPELEQQEYRPQFNPASEMSPRQRYSERHAPIAYAEADGRPGRQEMPS
ncbi:hypothetical protein DL98DRAFT_597644 [Cadophora sp. DSE1049]|nr:hypothetical protein DL98DRAFT_597644 [Cadophora sp. DSE1049]